MSKVAVKTTKRQRLILIAAFLYLFFAVLGAWTKFPYELPEGYKKIFYAFMDYTGTNNDFGYFAPGVASQLKTSFILRDSTHNQTTFSFETDNDEVNLRINSLIMSAMKKTPLQNIFARSWAAFLLGSLPGTERVTVITQAHIVPTLKEYQLGKKIHWITVHQGTFEKIPQPIQ